MTVSLDWENLGFSYMKLPYRYIAYYRNGAWKKENYPKMPLFIFLNLLRVCTTDSKLLRV